MDDSNSQNYNTLDNEDLDSNSLNNDISYNENVYNRPLTKKEKADAAGRDVAEMAAKGLSTYYGGAAGGKIADAALQTKLGQKVIGKASKEINKNPVSRHLLAKNQNKINSAKPFVNSLVGGMNNSGNTPTNGESNLNSIGKISNTNSNTQSENKVDGSGSIKGLLKKLPLKAKLIIIGCIASFASTLIFIVILITPLMELGIIDISGIGDSIGSGNISSGGDYISVPNNISYWWPVESNNSVITSPFGQRKDPKDRTIKMHNGIDIAISGGIEPGVIDIIASNSGTVTQVIDYCPTTKSIHDGDESDDQCGGRYGNYIMITHDDGKMTVYAHLYSVSVSKDSRVNKGQVIGTMGSSGKSTGTHLHFEVRVNGERQNPENFVSKENRKP